MANEYLKSVLRNRGVLLWEVADALGVSEATLTRLMRHPLSVEAEERILAAAEEKERRRAHAEQT